VPALLLAGHGTRSAGGRRQFLHLAAQMQRRLPRVQVQPAFLELAEPTIDEAVAALSATGVEQMVVVPLLLFAAGHTKRDIPTEISAAVAHAPMKVLLADPLGCEPEILELSHRRFSEAIAGHWQVSPEESCLLLVGRGSSDESATAAMHEFASLRQRMEGGMHTEVAFLAKARPSLAEQLPRIAGLGFRRIVVQPHLLFAGELAASIERQVAAAAAQYSQTEWLLASLLADPPGECGGGTELLAQVICERYRRSLQWSASSIRGSDI